MELFSRIREVFQCGDIHISDRRTTAEAFFETTVANLPDAGQLAEILNLIPQRDLCSLTLKNDCDDIVIITKAASNTIDLSQLLDEAEENDYISETIP